VTEPQQSNGRAELDPTESSSAGSLRSRHARVSLLVKILISVVAAILVLIHLIHPNAPLDSTLLVLLGVAVTPWLGVVFESVDTPFGGVKYRDLEQRVNQLTAESSSLRIVQGANEARDRAQRVGNVSNDSSNDRLNELAAEYVSVRDPRSGKRSGDARTQLMTRIVGEMIAAADSGATIPLESALHSGDLGLRLAAYAVLYSHPDNNYTIPLVDSVIDLEPKPFGQFWGLRAISRLIEVAGPNSIDLDTARRLRDFKSQLPASSDRTYELRKILSGLGID